MSDDNIPTLGRGRGRGVTIDPRNTFKSTDGNSSRQSTSDDGSKGEKRSAMQDRPDRNKSFYKTRTKSVEETKQGTSGKKLKLSANYFQLIRKPHFEFSLYRVDFEPEVEMAPLRKAFVMTQRLLLGGYLFDGANMIYLTKKLEKTTETFHCESRLGIRHAMTIKDTGTTIRMTDAMATQILNVILRRTMDGLALQLVGRNMYDPKTPVRLEQFKVELWPGYITSIRQHEHEILVCCEVSHKVMRQETVYDIMRTARNADSRNWQENFKKEIIGSIVLTDYNNRTYRVDDVDFASSPMSTFDQKGKEITYKEYYNTRYAIVVNDIKQPMLVSNPKASDIHAGRTQVLFLVPELCRATGLTDKMRSNFTMMRSMAEHTHMNPQRRKDRLMELNRRLHNTEKSLETLVNHNTDLGSELVSFEGRGLNQEMMLFGGGKSCQNDDRVDWTNGVRSAPQYKSIDLKRWAIIFPQRLERETIDFLTSLHQVARGMTYTMGDPKMIKLSDDRKEAYVYALEEISGKDPKMIMCVVPNNAADRYAAIKRKTCVERAIPTQVIVAKTLQPKKGGLMSIATKVMIQLNCKLGGAPWMIKFPLKGVMAIGFDVSHDSRDRSKSYGAFVASMDLKEDVQFFSGVCPHSDGAEVSNNITNFTNQALREFKEKHGALPEQIFFYRDGVGDGQIELVHKQEVGQLTKHLNAVYAKHAEGREVKLAFIIVNKRLNTRIFLRQGAAGVTNPVSGTVVDDVITLPERYDFFLVSQSVRQGTVAPTSYNIIHDTSGLPPDKLQMLTYKYTHLYYNWSGCVRVPAVVQYAHKLAMLVSQFLHQPPQPSMNKQLYFL